MRTLDDLRQAFTWLEEHAPTSTPGRRFGVGMVVRDGSTPRPDRRRFRWIPTHPRLVAVAVAAFLAVGAATAAGVVHFAGNGGGHVRPGVIAADTLLPAETLADWVSFSDHLIVATLVSERALQPTQSESAAKEGYIPRVITFDVDGVLWSRSQAPSAPVSFETQLDGWVFHGDERTLQLLRGEPDMEVGKQYILPIVYFSVTTVVPTAGWSIFSPGSIFPYQSGVLGQGSDIPTVKGVRRNDTVRQQFIGKSPAQLVAALNLTAAYPAAIGAMDLPPDVRAQLVGPH